MAFDAGTVVEPLNFTLMPFVDAKGTVPEPTDKMISDFLKGLQEMAKEFQGKAGLDLDENASPADLMAKLNELEISSITDLLAGLTKLVAALCGGKPTEAQLMELPPRHRMKFFEWIQGEVISPEAGPAAGIAQVVNLPRAAGG